ncbi:MAG: OmpA family protein, partial [Deltaproteobacteria bacterium]|nr:OmpA family protein [Deltaproteobacteria bacterium]
FLPSTRRLVHVEPPPPLETRSHTHVAMPPPAPSGDADHDGIPDDRDVCPTQAETINGNDDDDGCPDAGDSLVLVAPSELELLAPVKFTAGAHLDPASLNVLGQAGALLRAHPELAHVRIVAHVNPSGDPDADLALSQHRADAVVSWLVQWGIAPSRLEARGFGSLHTLVDPEDDSAPDVNARVEILVLAAH